MPITDSNRQLTDIACESGSPCSACDQVKRIQSAFGVPLAVIDVNTGDVVFRDDDFPLLEAAFHWPTCGEVARRKKPELIGERDPFWIMALPIPGPDEVERVAILPLVGRAIAPGEDSTLSGITLGLYANEATAWAMRQPVWPPAAAMRMSEIVLEQLRTSSEISRLKSEVSQLSGNINSTYEEISLLHRLTQNLRLSHSDEELAHVALEWLEEVVPASCVAIYLTPAGRSETMGTGNRPINVFLTRGDCPIGADEFALLARAAWDRFGKPGRPLVLNRGMTASADWSCPEVREAIYLPLAEGQHRFGWVAAMNHASGGEFGSVEASLMGSVAAILGIHSGNILLYQEQAELTAGVIRALTEAIDAKDQYTCGHSDRVARIAVRLAQELNCDLPTINTIYLAGLLHDVGKIGILDDVLRKPGKLTAEEYEHIKTHPAVGHRILRDIKKLDHILPAILHHHESWNGTGYPQQLAAEAIPLTARIVAVADSYDAMGSDRPYRKGMPRQKIEEIFRKESGVQWDPQVVAAFFRAETDLQEIVNDQRRDLALEFSTPRN